MKPRQNLILAAGILILAISGNAIWLGEILHRFTWASLGWIYNTLYSPFLLAAFPAFAFLLPFILSKKSDAVKLVRYGVVSYFINILFYFFGDHFFTTYLGRWAAFWMYNRLGNLFIAYLWALTLLIFGLFGIAYFLSIRYLLVKIRPLYILFFSLIIIPVFPLSCFTYWIIPVVDGEYFFNAIKAGYPVFWTTIMMGLAGWWVEKRTGKFSR